MFQPRCGLHQVRVNWQHVAVFYISLMIKLSNKLFKLYILHSDHTIALFKLRKIHFYAQSYCELTLSPVVSLSVGLLMPTSPKEHQYEIYCNKWLISFQIRGDRGQTLRDFEILRDKDHVFIPGEHFTRFSFFLLSICCYLLQKLPVGDTG